MSTRSRQRLTGSGSGPTTTLPTPVRTTNAWSRPLQPSRTPRTRPSPKPIPAAPKPQPKNQNLQNQNLQNVLRERFLHLSQSLVGQRITLTQNNGTIIEGIFHTFTPFRDFAPEQRNMYVISNCKVIKSANGSNVAEGSTVILPAAKVAQILAKSMRVEGSSRNLENNDLRTDNEIAALNNTRKTSDLVAAGSAWTTPNPAPSQPHLQGSIGEWDQFRANEQLFSVHASFDEDIYTTPLNKSHLEQDQIEKAERIAKEIEGTTSTNVHLMEERGQKPQGDDDEEDLYSGVKREEKPVWGKGRTLKSLIEEKKETPPTQKSVIKEKSPVAKEKASVVSQKVIVAKENSPVAKEKAPVVTNQKIPVAKVKVPVSKEKLPAAKEEDKEKTILPKKNYASVAAAAVAVPSVKYPPGLKVKASVPVVKKEVENKESEKEVEKKEPVKKEVEKKEPAKKEIEKKEPEKKEVEKQDAEKDQDEKEKAEKEEKSTEEKIKTEFLNVKPAEADKHGIVKKQENETLTEEKDKVISKTNEEEDEVEGKGKEEKKEHAGKNATEDVNLSMETTQAGKQKASEHEVEEETPPKIDSSTNEEYKAETATTNKEIDEQKEEKEEDKKEASKKKAGSKLNANAKEFTFNPSAASFTPGSGFNVAPSSSPAVSEHSMGGPPTNPQYMHHPAMQQHGMMPMMNAQMPMPNRYPYPGAPPHHNPNHPQHLQMQQPPMEYDSSSEQSQPSQPQQNVPMSYNMPPGVYYPMGMPPRPGMGGFHPGGVMSGPYHFPVVPNHPYRMYPPQHQPPNLPQQMSPSFYPSNPHPGGNMHYQPFMNHEDDHSFRGRGRGGGGRGGRRNGRKNGRGGGGGRNYHDRRHDNDKERKEKEEGENPNESPAG